MKTTEQHSFAGISPGASVLPFAFFVTTVIGLSFFDVVLLLSDSTVSMGRRQRKPCAILA
jgi:hypothetical protein